MQAVLQNTRQKHASTGGGTIRCQVIHSPKLALLAEAYRPCKRTTGCDCHCAIHMVYHVAADCLADADIWRAGWLNCGEAVVDVGKKAPELKAQRVIFHIAEGLETALHNDAEWDLLHQSLLHPLGGCLQTITIGK